jgi:homoserine O-acetyltransferase
MVVAQYRLVTEGLGLRHLRLVLGNSMGGMHTWIWGAKYPDFMDALVPMASQPAEMSSRNWMMRRLITDSIRSDPEWNNGNYTSQPRSARVASVFYGIATAGGTLAYQKIAPTREAADKVLNERLFAPFAADANDILYAWDSSRDYNPAPGLERIQATLLAINSADDERNPPETGIMERELKRVKNARLFTIPASEDTRGHGTTGMAKFYKQPLAELLQTALSDPADLFYGGTGGGLSVATMAGRRTGKPYALDLEDFHTAELEDAPGTRFRHSLIGRIERDVLPGAAFITAAIRCTATGCR